MADKIVGFSKTEESVDVSPKIVTPQSRSMRFGMNKDDVMIIRQILEESDDRTHMGIALAIINAGFTRVIRDN